MSALKRTIHGGFRQLGIVDDADRRAIYARITGKNGLSVMTMTEQQAVADELRRLGFRKTDGSTSGARRKLTGKFRPKLQALWIAGFNLNIIRDPDDRAMLAFIKRQTGLDDTRFLYDAFYGRKAIEALKAWLAREAGVDWYVGRGMPAWMRQPACQIARAQWKILSKGAETGFWKVVTDLLDIEENERDLSRDQWILVMNYFGASIRVQAGAK